MRKSFKALFGFFALFSLIACGNNKSSKSESSSENKSIVESSISSSQEERSSSYEEVVSISSNDADEEWSNDESTSSIIESTSIEQSSILDESSSSEVIISSEQNSSSSESESSSQEGTYYHVTFVNYDDSVLYEVDVLEGEAAVYGGDTPVKKADDDFEYEFDGWDKDLSSITSDVTAKAQYKSVPKKEWGPINWFIIRRIIKEGV